MSKASPTKTASFIRFGELNWTDSSQLSGDQAQSHRLHAPEHRISTIDPITGDDIENVTSHPSQEDGDLTMYFSTDCTRKAYLVFRWTTRIYACPIPRQTVITRAAEPLT
jgi:hypothetical protein